VTFTWSSIFVEKGVSMIHRSRCAAPALICLTFVSLTRAEPSSSVVPTRPVSPSSTPERPADARIYTYEFSDDPLAAGGFGANDARIIVAGHAIRVTLIRPRTTFVAEMLKTVENL
jgi:hypothetical protein